jgi:hypothetical protein
MTRRHEEMDQAMKRIPLLTRPRLWLLPVLATSLLLLSSCRTTESLTEAQQQMVDQRALAIAAEPPGDYWIGRRWWTKGTRFWGYVRRPRQQWSEAKLVMMYEGHKKTPDRLPEELPTGRTHGFDHNYEYRLWGSFSGGEIYDPNSDLILPEFVLRNYELINSNPGYLFHPGERYLATAMPPLYPSLQR